MLEVKTLLTLGPRGGLLRRVLQLKLNLNGSVLKPLLLHCLYSLYTSDALAMFINLKEKPPIVCF